MLDDRQMSDELMLASLRSGCRERIDWGVYIGVRVGDFTFGKILGKYSTFFSKFSKKVGNPPNRIGRCV